MALGLFLMLIILIVLASMALLIVGILFIISGTRNKKQGGKGTKRTIGIVMVAIPAFFTVCIGAWTLWYNASVKCVADEWRYKPFFMPRNAVEGSSVMLRELLESADDEDEDKFYREFSENVRDDRYFEDTVEDFFDDLNELDVELDPDDFLKDNGKDVHLEGDKDTYLDGRIYSAKIDGKKYYCYVRICITNYADKDDVGLQQFIVCDEDKVDELYEIIEKDKDDIYLYVL